MRYTKHFTKAALISATALITISLFVGFASCTKKGKDQVIFYVCNDCGVGGITVEVDGTVAGTLNSYLLACDPADGQTDNVVSVHPSEGSHTYKAYGATGGSWSGTFNTDTKHAVKIQLACSGNGNNNTNTGCNAYNLTGSWMRQNDGGCSGSAGMVVYFNGSRGTITSVPSNSCGFYTGQVKWQNADLQNCNIDDLNMPGGDYYNYDISFSGPNTFTVGSVSYSRQ
jgi:hypothetical protein